MNRILPILAAALLAPLSAADLEVAGIFADHGVLQRDQAVPVWGRANPGALVSVEFAGQSKTSTADAAGIWRVKLDAMPASAEARPLVVRAQGAPTPVTLSDVLVGDVWLCAGGVDTSMRGTDADALPEDAQAPPLRVFSVALTPARDVQPDVKGRWIVAQANSLKTFPVQAWHLGRALGRELGVPVGIVSVTTWGGMAAPVESWTSREALAAAPEAAPILAYYAGDAWKMRTVGSYDERLKAWLEFCQKLPLNPPPKPQPNDVDKLAQQEPSAVWNSGLAPLAGLALRGVVWDCGEDTASQGHAFQQGQLLPPMIANWRQAFGNVDLPFIIVQLRPHCYAVSHGIDGRLAAELRDAQRSAATAAKAALVVTVDLGADPSPREVTARIANTILAKAYQKTDRDPGGPQFVRAVTTGDRVTLHFSNTHGGLTAKGGKLQGFAIADTLLRWVWADATIAGDTVILSAPTVPKPLGVRYAYQDAPWHGATLCDGAGHPAAPFRTDEFLALTDRSLDPSAVALGFNRRTDLAIEDPRLPRILIIGDSISGHYLEELRVRMSGKANVIGESSMIKGTWASMGPRFYRADWASRPDFKTFLAERGPFAIVHFNNGIHNFSHAKPGDEKPYAEQLRTVVASIRESGALCLFANSTGTVADNTIPNSPNYLTNCRAFNAAAEAVMKELKVPVTDIYGLIQPRIQELISSDLVHPKDEASPLMADLIARRLTETLATLAK